MVVPVLGCSAGALSGVGFTVASCSVAWSGVLVVGAKSGRGSVGFCVGSGMVKGNVKVEGGAVAASQLGLRPAARTVGRGQLRGVYHLAVGFPLQPVFPLAVTNSTTDFYHQKTDDELRFFVENPDYYQPDIVAEARRELRRRGVALPQPALLPPAAVPAPPARGLQTGPLALAVAAVLALSLGGLYFIKQKNAVPTVALVEAKPKAPPRLTEVATSTIPDFGPAVTSSVQRQVQRIPAAERAAAAQEATPLRQYRELAKRFWTAETQTEFVMNQARHGQLDAALPGHIQAVGATWEQWNKALRYSYKFGPAMAAHLDIMTRVAQQQQEGLGDLLIVASNPQSYENDQTRKRAADVSDLLSGLLPKSPVTGQPYNTLVRRVRL